MIHVSDYIIIVNNHCQYRNVLIDKSHLGIPVILHQDTMVTRVVPDLETALPTGDRSTAMVGRGVPRLNLDQTIRPRFNQIEIISVTYPATYRETLLGGRKPYSTATLLVDLGVAATRVTFGVGDVEGEEAGAMTAGTAGEIGTSISEIEETRLTETSVAENVIAAIGEIENEIALEAAEHLLGVDHLSEETSAIQGT